MNVMFFHPTAAFKAYLAAQREAERDYALEESSRSIHGDPCSCQRCKSTNLDEKTTSSSDYIVLEYEVVCKDCLAKVGYWAHGSFEPNFPPEECSYF